MPPPSVAAFRPDIQGMRAVAVIAVILFHVNPILLKGGFVGVDIFFVISGFVMGRLVYREVSENRFSWRGFLLRRIRRIMPALLVMITAVTSLLPFIVGPERAVGQAKVALAAIFGVSNIPLWITMKYFGPSAETHALLHTWSLAVEEQFYLILPLLLLWITRKQPARIIEILLVIIAISLAAAQLVLNTRYQTGAFYLIPFRGWELGLGLVAAISADHGAFQSLSTRTRETIAWIGTAVISASLLLLSEDILFPGLSALPACLGTCFLLAAGPSASVSRVLSTRPLLWIGGISYSLYLWHVPCLAITRIITEKDLTPASACAAIAATLALSIASFYLIEQPFRAPHRQPAARLTTPLITITTAALLIAISVITSNGLDFRYSPEQKMRFQEISLTKNYEYVYTRFSQLDLANNPFPADAKPRILIVGDSFGRDLTNVLAEAGLLERMHIRTVFFPVGCQVATPFEDAQSRRKPRDRPICRRGARMENVAAISSSVDTVVLASDWRLWSAGMLPNSVKLLKKAGCRNIVILGTKRWPTFSDRAVCRGASAPDLLGGIEESHRTNAEIRQAVGTGAHFLDCMSQIIDAVGMMPATDSSGKIISYDGQHLTQAGAKFFGEKLDLSALLMR